MLELTLRLLQRLILAWIYTDIGQVRGLMPQSLYFSKNLARSVAIEVNGILGYKCIREKTSHVGLCCFMGETEVMIGSF